MALTREKEYNKPQKVEMERRLDGNRECEATGHREEKYGDN